MAKAPKVKEATNTIFQFSDYRDYLVYWVKTNPNGGRGSRNRMAEFLRCQGSFISQVFHKTAHLTLEHAEKLNLFLEHTHDESDFFLLLLQYQRAGTESLRHYFQKKIEEIHSKRLVLKNRISSGSIISDATRLQYYSAWHYAAIRLLLTIPTFQTKEKLVERLKLPSSLVYEALEFLVQNGLVVQEGNRFLANERHLHLGNTDSPLVRKHHMNWRVQALRSLDLERENEVHYSMGMTISRKDMIRLKAMIVDFVEEVQKIARPSESELFCAFCVDFFEP